MIWSRMFLKSLKNWHGNFGRVWCYLLVCVAYVLIILLSSIYGEEILACVLYVFTEILKVKQIFTERRKVQSGRNCGLEHYIAVQSDSLLALIYITLRVKAKKCRKTHKNINLFTYLQKWFKLKIWVCKEKVRKIEWQDITSGTIVTPRRAGKFTAPETEAVKLPVTLHILLHLCYAAKKKGDVTLPTIFLNK